MEAGASARLEGERQKGEPVKLLFQCKIPERATHVRFIQEPQKQPLWVERDGMKKQDWLLDDLPTLEATVRRLWGPAVVSMVWFEPGPKNGLRRLSASPVFDLHSAHMVPDAAPPPALPTTTTTDSLVYMRELEAMRVRTIADERARADAIAERDRRFVVDMTQQLTKANSDAFAAAVEKLVPTARRKKQEEEEEEEESEDDEEGVGAAIAGALKEHLPDIIDAIRGKGGKKKEEPQEEEAK